MATDAEFLAGFESQQWPHEHFHHREHIRLAYLYLLRHDVDDALTRLRTGIQAYNAAHGIVLTPTGGYHETITAAWLRIVHCVLCEYGREADSEAFCDAHPELLEKRMLRLFYSRDRLLSPQARAEFITPDLAPLPTPRCHGESNDPP